MVIWGRNGLLAFEEINLSPLTPYLDRNLDTFLVKTYEVCRPWSPFSYVVTCGRLSLYSVREPLFELFNVALAFIRPPVKNLENGIRH